LAARERRTGAAADERWLPETYGSREKDAAWTGRPDRPTDDADAIAHTLEQTRRPAASLAQCFHSPFVLSESSLNVIESNCHLFYFSKPHDLNKIAIIFWV
jgi:hypothetical protein